MEQEGLGMAGAVNILIDIEQKVRGNAAPALNKLEGALKRDETAIRRLESAQKRLGKSSTATAGQMQSISSALDANRSRLAQNASAYAKLSSSAGGMSQLAGATQSAGGAMGMLSGGMGKAALKATLIAAAVGMVVSAAKRAVTALLDMGRAIHDAAMFGENLQFSLTRFLGSSTTAKGEIASLLKLSNKLGLDFNATAANFQELVSAGFTADASKELIALKADLLAMSTGTVEAQSKIESAFAQIAKGMAAGRLEAGEFNEILKNLPVTKAQILEKLAPKLGKSMDELSKMEITKMPVEKLIEAMKEATLAATGTSKAGETAAEKSATTMSGALDKLKARAGNVWDDIASRMESGGMADVINSITDAFDSPMVGAVMDGIAGAIELIGGAITAVWPIVEGLFAGLEAGFMAAKPGIEAMVEAIGSISSETDVGIIDILAGALKVLGAVLGFVVGAIGVFVAGVALIGASLWAAANDVVNFKATLDSELGGLVGDALSWFQDVDQQFAEVGGSIVGGVADGIISGKDEVISAITGIANDAVAAAKSILGIASPSRVFRRIGEQVMAGYAEGVEGGMPVVRQTIEAAVRPVQPSQQSYSSTTTNNRNAGGVTIIVQGGGDAQQTAVMVRQQIADYFDGLAPEGA